MLTPHCNSYNWEFLGADLLVLNMVRWSKMTLKNEKKSLVCDLLDETFVVLVQHPSGDGDERDP